MSISSHLVLTIISQMAGLFGGFLLFIYSYHCSNPLPPPVSMLLFALPGFFVPKLLFRHVIPAKCPACEQPAFPRGSRSVMYRCTVCRQEHHTNVSEG